jgi:integrase
MAQRRENLLTSRQVETAGDGWHADGNCLYLRVDGSRRRWLVRVTRNGKKRDFGVGAVKTTTLAFARRKRDAILAQLADGVDPIQAKREAREQAKVKALAGHSFRECATAVMEAREGAWKQGSSSFASWRKSLFIDAKPLHRLAVEAITVEDVKRILQPFWDRGHHTAARRVLTCVELTISYGIAHGWRTAGNPALWSVFRHIAPHKPNGKKHHAALPWEEMPSLYRQLGKSDGLSALALRLIILSGLRSGEARGARWEEFNWGKRVWMVPGVRMKRGKEFPVPITDQMLALLKPPPEAKGLIFPGPRPGRPIANQGCWTMIKRTAVGKEITTHGCRSSFRSWMADHGYEFEVAEAALSHAPGSSTVQAYHRTPLLERRRPAYQEWADFLDGSASVRKFADASALRKRR